VLARMVEGWGDAATHLAHSAQPLKLYGVPYILPLVEPIEVLRLIPWVPL